MPSSGLKNADVDDVTIIKYYMPLLITSHHKLTIVSYQQFSTTTTISYILTLMANILMTAVAQRSALWTLDKKILSSIPGNTNLGNELF